jgi:hypothetical protein
MAQDARNTTAAGENQPHPFIKNSVLLLMENITAGQYFGLKRAAERGEFEQEYLTLIEAIATKMEKDPAAPATAPASPSFDLEAYRQAILDAGGFAAVSACVDEKMEEAAQIELSAEDRAAIREFAAIMTESARKAFSEVQAFMQSDTYKEIKASVDAVSEFMQKHKAEIAAFAQAAALLDDVGQRIRDLVPFLKMELDEAQNDPQLKGKTVNDILRHGLTTTGELTESPYKELILRAKERLKEYEEAEETIAGIEQAATELPRIISNPTDTINYPLDKPNSVIWNLIADAAKTNPNGQLQLNINTSKKGSKQDAIIYYGINFDEIETGVKITKQLTPFDKRCYIAAAALFNAGNDIISATQLYSMMGNPGKPQASDIKKINDSITKMGAARVYIDNERETKAAKGYQHFKYDAALLPFERISAYINGQLTDSAIHLFREPPLMSFARQRNQITTVSRQLLESPVSKTDANLRIDDYLLERIGHMKRKKSTTPQRMLFVTIYKQCGITTAKQKQRAPEKIRRYLDYYKKCGWIKGYTEDADGITILL